MHPIRRRNLRRRGSRRRGFTLMEVLLVLAILVILGSIVVANFSGVFSKSKISAAKTQIKAFETPIELYALDVGQPPTSQQGLSALRQAPPDLPDVSKWGPEPYLKKEIPKDPWGNDYVYEFLGGGQYKISSPGPDGQLGTADDLTNEQ